MRLAFDAPLSSLRLGGASAGSSLACPCAALIVSCVCWSLSSLSWRHARALHRCCDGKRRGKQCEGGRATKNCSVSRLSTLPGTVGTEALFEPAFQRMFAGDGYSGGAELFPTTHKLRHLTRKIMVCVAVPKTSRTQQNDSTAVPPSRTQLTPNATGRRCARR